MEYNLLYTASFYTDLYEAVTYIENILKSPDAANKLIDKVEYEIQKRVKAPLTYPPYPLERPHKKPYYYIMVGNYLVFYVVIGNVMEVRRFLYSKRNMSELL